MLRSCLQGVYNNILLSPLAPSIRNYSFSHQWTNEPPSSLEHTLGLHESPSVYYRGGYQIVVALLVLPFSLLCYVCGWVVSELLINIIERDYPEQCGLLPGFFLLHIYHANWLRWWIVGGWVVYLWLYFDGIERIGS